MSNGFSVSYLKNVHPLMLSVIDTFCNMVEEKIEKEGKDGEVIMDLYNPLSHLTTVQLPCIAILITS